jgi:hypothetical protein
MKTTLPFQMSSFEPWPRRKRMWACLVGTQIYPTNFLAAYTILVLVWLVANILVAYGILPTLVTLPL